MYTFHDVVDICRKKFSPIPAAITNYHIIYINYSPLRCKRTSVFSINMYTRPFTKSRNPEGRDVRLRLNLNIVIVRCTWCEKCNTLVVDAATCFSKYKYCNKTNKTKKK